MQQPTKEKKEKFMVKEIVDDEKVRVVPRLGSPSDIEKIEAPYRNFPKLDHSKTYEKVFEHLSQGKCIGIFPEVKFLKNLKKFR